METLPEQLLNHDIDILPGKLSGVYWMPQGLSGDRPDTPRDPFGFLVCHVIVIPKKTSFDAFSLSVASATGTLKARIAIYALDGTNNNPNTLIQDVGEQGPGLTSGTLVTWPVSPVWSPEPGAYGIALAANEAGTWTAMTPSSGGLIPFRGKIVGSDVLPVYRVDGTFTYAAAPSTFPSTITEQTAIGGFQIWPRIA